MLSVSSRPSVTFNGILLCRVRNGLPFVRARQGNAFIDLRENGGSAYPVHNIDYPDLGITVVYRCKR